jgi:hypothetical protein
MTLRAFNQQLWGHSSRNSNQLDLKPLAHNLNFWRVAGAISRNLLH